MDPVGVVSSSGGAQVDPAGSPDEYPVDDVLDAGGDLDGHPLLALEQLLQLRQAFGVDLLQEGPVRERYGGREGEGWTGHTRCQDESLALSK